MLKYKVINVIMDKKKGENILRSSKYKMFMEEFSQEFDKLDNSQ